MSFHQSSSDIHIRQENGKTLLLCKAHDSHGGTTDNHIRLDDHIGNSDGMHALFEKMQNASILTMIGWFLWGGVNFSESSHNIQLENTDRGPKLTADLAMADGGSRGRQGLFLADKIENQDGRLRFTVSAKDLTIVLGSF